MISRSKWLPLKSIIVASPSQYLPEGYPASAESQTLRQIHAKPVADVVARHLGIAEVAANLLPEDKRLRVKRLVADGRVAAMVGDGVVNDAPALIEAHV
jgi:magnesium-transporting ATPase (P-type)